MGTLERISRLEMSMILHEEDFQEQLEQRLAELNANIQTDDWRQYSGFFDFTAHSLSSLVSVFALFLISFAERAACAFIGRLYLIWS
jgi:hypothetical protein